jgi:hypothetical protein
MVEVSNGNGNCNLSDMKSKVMYAFIKFCFMTCGKVEM